MIRRPALESVRKQKQPKKHILRVRGQDSYLEVNRFRLKAYQIRMQGVG